jgi:hypothetical protein
MPKRIEVKPGDKYNRWTVIKEHTKSSKKVKYLCQCDCGKIKAVESYCLRSGNSKSCGCLSSEITSNRNLTHGLSNHRLYHVWSRMHFRCTNPNDIGYKNYGGRGISVCKEWKEFLPFYEWAMANGYEKNLSIDRINNDGNYEPSNCRWATRKIQNNNTRKSVHITFNGQTKSLTEWAKELNITSPALANRLKKQSLKTALTTVKNGYEKVVTFNGITQTVNEWSKKTGIHSNTIHSRLRRGWSIEKALTTKTRNKK